MKIYVDGELPKECFDCPCHNGENGNCKILNKYTEYVPKDCPLKPLSDYTKQVREEVVEEIKEKFNDTIKHHFCPNPSSVDFITLCISEVEEFLDKVKGENNEIF